MRVVHVDGSRVVSKSEFLAAVAAALELPDYFGHNWDALDECLRDVQEPTMVEWSQAERLAEADPVAFDTAIRCFTEADAPVTLRLV